MSMQTPPRLRRYERRHEPDQPFRRERLPAIPAAEVESAIERSGLTPGAKAMARGLVDLAAVRTFAGGGLGIEYGSLLKTAVRPDIIAGHVQEAATHLREKQVDVLLVPGMSGWPERISFTVAPARNSLPLMMAPFSGPQLLAVTGEKPVTLDGGHCVTLSTPPSVSF